MMDVFTKKKRSWIMSRVAGRNTQPEIIVRKRIHRMGYRFRLYEKKLPGNPDIVLPRHKKVIFVHGCFWHQHKNCGRSKRPSTNKEFWDKKLDRTIERDRKNKRLLKELGWCVLTVWQCQTHDIKSLDQQLSKFLNT